MTKAEIVKELKALNVDFKQTESKEVLYNILIGVRAMNVTAMSEGELQYIEVTELIDKAIDKLNIIMKEDRSKALRLKSAVAKLVDCKKKLC